MGKRVTDVGFEMKPEPHELKKHAATIHCSNTLSLLQRKISNALLYHAYKELMLKEEHEISVKQLCQLISYSGNNHAAIREALKGLISTVIEWNVVDDSTGAEDWTASSIIASVSLKGPLCYYAYSPRMKQLLHSPSMFGKINLVIQSRFKSSYGLALYENCIRYRGLPHTKWLDIDMFRKLMGVPDGKYSVFRDFKKRVLDKAIEEINRFSELMVDVEFMREKRQVTRIRFSLKEREKKVRLGANVNSSDDEEKLKTKLMNDYGLSSEQAQLVLHEYSKDFIIEKIELIESSKNYQLGKVHNLTAYLFSALKNNFQPGKLKIGEPKKEGLITRKKAQRRLEEIKEEYRLYRESEIDRYLQMLPVVVMENFIKKFTDYAKDSIAVVLRVQRSKYNRETVFQSPQIKALMRQYALENIPEIQSFVKSVEQYIEELPEKERPLLSFS